MAHVKVPETYWRWWRYVEGAFASPMSISDLPQCTAKLYKTFSFSIFNPATIYNLSPTLNPEGTIGIGIYTESTLIVRPTIAVRTIIRMALQHRIVAEALCEACGGLPEPLKELAYSGDPGCEWEKDKATTFQHYYS